MDKIQVLLQNEEYIKGLVEASGGDFEVRIKNAIIDAVRKRSVDLLGEKNDKLMEVIKSAQKDVTDTCIDKYFTVLKDKWGYNGKTVLQDKYKKIIADTVETYVQRAIEGAIAAETTKVITELHERLVSSYDAVASKFVQNFDFEKAFREEMQKYSAKKFGEGLAK